MNSCFICIFGKNVAKNQESYNHEFQTHVKLFNILHSFLKIDFVFLVMIALVIK